MSADKLSVNDCELEPGLLIGLFFGSTPSFSLPELLDPSLLLPFSDCFKPPNRFRFGFGELSEDADDDLVPHFELSVAEHGPDDDFGSRDICFFPDVGVDNFLDLSCDLLSTGNLEISGAELQSINVYYENRQNNNIKNKTQKLLQNVKSKVNRTTKICTQNYTKSAKLK